MATHTAGAAQLTAAEQHTIEELQEELKRQQEARWVWYTEIAVHMHAVDHSSSTQNVLKTEIL